MVITFDRHESHSVIRLEGEDSLPSAGELKARLLEGLASGGDLHLDLEKVAELDVTLLQFIVAAKREAARAGVGFGVRLSPAAAAAAQAAGFDAFPLPPTRE